MLLCCCGWSDEGTSFRLRSSRPPPPATPQPPTHLGPALDGVLGVLGGGVGRVLGVTRRVLSGVLGALEPALGEAAQRHRCSTWVTDVKGETATRRCCPTRAPCCSVSIRSGQSRKSLLRSLKSHLGGMSGVLGGVLRGVLGVLGRALPRGGGGMAHGPGGQVRDAGQATAVSPGCSPSGTRTTRAPPLCRPYLCCRTVHARTLVGCRHTLHHPTGRWARRAARPTLTACEASLALSSAAWAVSLAAICVRAGEAAKDQEHMQLCSCCAECTKQTNKVAHAHSRAAHSTWLQRTAGSQVGTGTAGALGVQLKCRSPLVSWLARQLQLP